MKNNEFGFSTLEILIALTLLILSITAAEQLVCGAQEMALDSQMNQLGLSKAGGLLEAARAQAAAKARQRLAIR